MESNLPVQCAWTCVCVSALLILRGQINLRFPVPRYIIKLSGDFRTAIRQMELLLPMLLEWTGGLFHPGQPSACWSADWSVCSAFVGGGVVVELHLTSI